MERISMKYGGIEVPVDVTGAGSVSVLRSNPPAAILDLRAAFTRAVTAGCVGSAPLNELLRPEDLVTIVISDVTRLWSRQDLIAGLLVEYLHEEVGMPYDHMLFLVALGTHRKQTEEELRRLVSPEAFARVQIVQHDCDAADLVHVGTTGRGTRVCVNPLVVTRKMILIGATVHHLMSGYGGGRKSILPGVSARETVYQNHLHSLAPDKACSNPLIGMGVLADNPLHEDMMEAAAFVNPLFGINITAYGGRPCALCCGHWAEAWAESCRIAAASFGVPIRAQADIVVASCGGDPYDIDLYQGTKSLLNAAQAVKTGGTLVFLAECREGGGSPAFFGWIDSLKRGTLDPDLRRDFNVAGYIFYAACEAMARAETVMLTKIQPETLAAMGIRAGDDPVKLLQAVDFSGKSVYLMPMAGSTVPCLG